MNSNDKYHSFVTLLLRNLKKDYYDNIKRVQDLLLYHATKALSNMFFYIIYKGDQAVESMPRV